MSIKKAIIKTNDALAYIAFAAVAVIAALLLAAGKIGPALLVFAGGWVICSLLFGLWFVLSDLSDTMRKIADK